MTFPAGQSSTRLAIGLDVGGTKIAGGVIASDGRIIERDSIPTPPTEDQSAALGMTRNLVGRFMERYPGAQALGVGAAGMVDWPSGHIRWAPNNSYQDLPLRARLSYETGLPTVVDNDANAAAWAEALTGAGVGYRNLAILTVGTGVGAGLILDGQIYRGSTGIGGEFGHVIVDPTGPTCGCGASGCLEALASGSALGRYGREAARNEPEGLMATLAGGAEAVTGEIVFRAARQGDPAACALFEKTGYWLGIGIASLVSLLDLELIVIGGGLSATGDLLINPTRSTFERYVFAPQRRKLPEIVTAHLGKDAGIVGAALLALSMLEGR